jgi:exopolyphosphatase/pppGpp-phosphohydrolase
MHDLKWSDREKKLSRQVYDAALQRELAEIVTEFKAQAGRVTTAEQLWPLEDYLRRKRREIDTKYDYRYSQLLIVFARLLREQRIEERDLSGLSEDKLDVIRGIAAL